MTNRPVYRYAPRSHVYNCPCNRCVQVRSRRTGGGDLIKFDMGCLGVLLVAWLISVVVAGIGWAVKNGGEIGHVTLAVVPPVAILVVTVWAVIFFNRRQDRRELARLAAPPTKPPAGPPPRPKRPSPSLPNPPQPRLCLHRNAVRVGSAVNGTVILENWCPDCENTLGAAFRWLCCGGAPTDRPGDGHVYNCPRRP